MSLRRSARVASSSAIGTPEAKALNGTAKYEKINKSAPASKKRKSRASATSPSQPTEEESNGTIIAAPDLPFVVPELPATPLPKRRKAASESPVKPLPFTPTPSGVGLIASTTREYGHPLEDLAGLKSRPAEPHATNAPLSTPGGSRVVAYQSSPIMPPPSASQDAPPASQESPTKKRKAKEYVPPDVGVIPAASTNIDRLLKDAEEFLVKIDPKLQGLVEKHHCKMFSPEGLREVVDPFTALSSGIIGQQVSGQAAASIRKKFTALFPETHPSFPSPAQVIAKDLPTLRTAGLSQRKAEYISGLAEKFTNGEFTAQMLVSASDEELIEKLVAVRGLGRWSVEMFACFGLKRMDVFSTGDLGVQRGMATYMGRDTNKLKAKGGKWKYMSEKEMLDIASQFSPYRSLFMWYMWRIVDVDISVMH
ncbi:DNA glycosylase [Cucurbitaria berberidis CBS 394.84]|uniref:DNA glycosylase n=1 Tax=Cucurbitaria berberidis CBS 394.84 TaxID=1168544 RepID=A0A9P4LCC7_9PLEO|nr:DNA glycosylase [Cucurbitaria berberidis CBS 394.84]KAF1849875.1 DNA glycosylase [Cucurbitaria berberidis CBS 394.84]